MLFFRWLALAIASGLVVFACTSSANGPSDGGVGDATGHDPTGQPCASDSVCGSGFGCAYPSAEGCSATGICEQLTIGACSAARLCACDGGIMYGCRFYVAGGPAYSDEPEDPSRDPLLNCQPRDGGAIDGTADAADAGDAAAE